MQRGESLWVRHSSLASHNEQVTLGVWRGIALFRFKREVRELKITNMHTHLDGYSIGSPVDYTQRT